VVHCGDSQDIPAFPHACARVCVYVCGCIGSLSLARVAWLCLVSSWPWYVKLNRYSAVSWRLQQCILLLPVATSWLKCVWDSGSENERITFVIFRKFKDQGLCSSLAKCIVMRCLAPVLHFWLPWVALAASASGQACVQVGWGSLTFPAEFMEDFQWHTSKFSQPVCPGFPICKMRRRY